MAFTQMNKTSMDDDDDDLESLRLAALQSLQKKTAESFDLGSSNPREHVHQKTYSPTNRRGRGSFHQSNRGRNGMFNNHNARFRNPNLISIPTEVEAFPSIETSSKVISVFTAEKDTYKLKLPQDRYCNKTVEKETKEQVSSKFSRYDNSDDSESESEEEDSEKSDSESTGLHRSGSLEALMEELENEIKGKSCVVKTDPVGTKAPKTKRRNKRLRTRTISNTAEKDLLQVNIDTEPINSPEQHNVSPTLEVNLDQTNEDNATASNLKNETQPLDKIHCAVKKLADKEEKSTLLQPNLDIRKSSPPRTMMRNRSPPPHRKQANSPHYREHRNRSPMQHQIQNNFNNTQFHTFPLQHMPARQIPPFGPLPYNIMAFQQFSLDMIHQQPPPFLPRTVSPLAINTEALCTITKAPLSPRSAAFVLQNREIIAQRRRKSPKRTFSRSVSRSLSPRRSLSPLSRRTLSKSPIRNRDRSRSPLPLRRLSPPRSGRNNSPPRRRRSLSPGNVRRGTNNNQRKPLRERKSPPLPNKPSIRDRLGIRGRDVVNKVEPIISQSEADKAATKIIVEEVVPEDPVLEARKRKFERTGINITDGGVIKLKKEEDTHHTEQLLSNEMIQSKTELPEVDEESLLLNDDTLLDTKADDTFSDDNESRFKAIDKPTGSSIDKSLDDVRNSKTDTLIKEDYSYGPRDQLDRKRRRRNSSLGQVGSSESDLVKTDLNKPQLKQHSSRKEKQSKKALPPRVTSPIENKKIEIKIRNPAKYEEQTTKTKYDVATEAEMRQSDEVKRKKKSRKVDVIRTDDTEAMGDEDGEIIAAGIDDEKLLKMVSSVDNKCSDGGDLRAQLSRKRAERQNKVPLVEAIQSRLLQTALEDAVFKRAKKSKKSKRRDGALKELDNTLLQQRVYCDNFFCKLTRLRLIEKEQELMENERVCVLYPEDKLLNSQGNHISNAPNILTNHFPAPSPVVTHHNGKLPIHLRLGLAGSDLEISSEHRKKSKKSKHRSVDQV